MAASTALASNCGDGRMTAAPRINMARSEQMQPAQ
jgi:hypothetical protein